MHSSSHVDTGKSDCSGATARETLEQNRRSDSGHSASHSLQPELEPFRRFWQAASSAPPDQEMDEEQAVAFLRQHGFGDPLISKILAKCEDQLLERATASNSIKAGVRTAARRPSVSGALCLLGDDCSETGSQGEPAASSSDFGSRQRHRQPSFSSLASSSNSSTATSFSPCDTPPRGKGESSSSSSPQSPWLPACEAQHTSVACSLPPPFPGYTRICLNLK
jgi:hypothetical protein